MADKEQDEVEHATAHDPLQQTVLHCGLCNKKTKFSAAVSVILLFAPGLKEPYPLIPSVNYRVCMNVDDKRIPCAATFMLIDKAKDSHPTTRVAGFWSRAVLVFKDGVGADVKAKRDYLPMAQA